jgi:hypothetical protein
MFLVPLGFAVADERETKSEKFIYLKDVYVAGLQFHEFDTPESIKALRAGDALSLRREPENPYDEFAIGVFDAAGRKLGFIPMYQNRTVARIMDQDVRVVASVERIADDSAPWKRVTIKVMEVLLT